MTKEEIDKWLDEEYGCSYTRLEELHDWLVDKDIKNRDEIKKLQQELTDYKEENEELRDRINKIDKFVSKLSSVGRDCEIYADVKRDILKVVRGNNNE